MSRGKEIWIIDDDRSIRWVLERALSQADMNVISFETADAALRRLSSAVPDVIVADIRMPGTDGLAMMQQVKERHPDLPVIIMTAYADLDRAVAAFQGGAFEYMPKPFDIDDAVSIVRRAVRKQAENEAVVQARGEPGTDMIGAAPAMQEVFRAIGRLSRSQVTVLITGESGTGKELVARALQRHSPRVDRPFIALNTAAIPRELLESELFGHERGAFTGATQQRIGRFEQAHGGTLFLDEIGDMPAELQTRLLRVLADGEFYRVGGTTPIRVDVRVIAATHQDLEQRVKAGLFREDLFHRLNVIHLHIPPLRERREDIRPMVDHFLAAAARELEIEPKVIQADAASLMLACDWPGNVRQVENVCRWITVMAPGREVHVEDLPAELRNNERTAAGTDWQTVLSGWADHCLAHGEGDLLARAVPTVERILIECALRKTGGRRQDAARLLGWGRNTLTRKIKELDMDV
ncbi:MAG: DNA-binding transcriptional regulator NtrC [Gammaproteobacteria bacterium]|nr:DNA-binding transcriptional regulator NtrC [Gammaproteobacteria bacterium]